MVMKSYPQEVVNESVAILSALANENQFKVVCYLLNENHQTVSDIANFLGVDLPTASRCLNKLYRAGVVDRIRYSNTMVYNIKDRTVKHILDAVVWDK